MDELKAVLVGSLDCNYIQLYTKKKKKKKKKSKTQEKLENTKQSNETGEPTIGAGRDSRTAEDQGNEEESGEATQEPWMSNAQGTAVLRALMKYSQIVDTTLSQCTSSRGHTSDNDVSRICCAALLQFAVRGIEHAEQLLRRAIGELAAVIPTGLKHRLCLLYVVGDTFDRPAFNSSMCNVMRSLFSLILRWSTQLTAFVRC